MKFEDFKAKIERERDKLSAVSWEYLNEEGRKKRLWYGNVEFIITFCDNFCELEEAVSGENSKYFSEFQLEQIRKWAKEERESER